MQKSNNKWILLTAFLLASGGFLLPFWPLEALGILFAALMGHWIFALVLGLLLDLAYSAPTGMLHPLFFPFTLLAALSIVLRRIALQYFLDSSSKETL